MTEEEFNALKDNLRGTVKALDYLKSKVSKKDGEMIDSVVDANIEAELLLVNLYNSKPY